MKKTIMTPTMNKMWLGTELYTGSFGQKFTSSDLKGIIDYCADIGLDKIDTAECYGIEQSVEEMIGDALSGKRKNFIIATKFGHHWKYGKKFENFNLSFVEKQLENSLKNLKTDFIDIYYFHSGGNEEFDNEDLWNYLNKKKDSGIIGQLGLSLKHSLVIEKDYLQLIKAKEYGISIVQTVLNVFSHQSLDYVIPYCKKYNINVLGRMPLAKGLLSGVYDENHKFNEMDQRVYNHQINKTIISKYKDFNVEKAIYWCKKYLEEIVIGCKNINQIKNNYLLINTGLDK